MRKYIVISGMLILIISLCIACQQIKNNEIWEEYKPHDGNFVVSYPDELSNVKVVKKNRQTEEGDIEVNFYMLTKNKNVYATFYCDKPIIKGSTKEEKLENAAKQFLNSNKGNLVSEKGVEQNGSIGRELVLKGSNNIVVRGRVFFENEKGYGVMVSTDKGNEYSPN
ncbi:MAG TPA: hypothetical protein VF941_24480, partial [Clostridia bacterium]